MPPDPTELLEVVEAYQKEVDKIKKKRGIESTDESIQLEINWAEYMVDAREMGMTEEEFFHSCPVFFCEQYEIFKNKRAEEVRAIYGR